MSKHTQRKLGFDHAPDRNEPAWWARRARGTGGRPYRETLFPLWLMSATLMALAGVLQWGSIPAVIAFPVCMMATLGLFWMATSPRRPRRTSPGRQTNRCSLRSGGASTSHRR